MKKLIVSASENLLLNARAMKSIRKPFEDNKLLLANYYAKNARRGRQVRVVEVVSK